MKSAGFAVRGVIEGFYGRPWSHEQRLDLLGFLGARGMNTYVHAPKADRPSWREAGDVQALCVAFERAMEAGAAGDDPYVRALGLIDARIDLFWTGRSICSATIDLADAAAVARALNRAPLYWDNYPVNDVAMGHKLHIGPYRGRDRHLYRFATGVVANGMELYESSKIAFATVADYLRDPEGYDPEESWERALADVVGDGADLAAYRLRAGGRGPALAGGVRAGRAGAAGHRSSKRTTAPPSPRTQAGVRRLS
ncbi:beta-N-acetylglucosaminidase domain-containing protein [Nonomuraea sp. NPDC001684]